MPLKPGDFAPPTPKKGSTRTGTFPIPANLPYTVGRVDQGVDIETQAAGVGKPVLAIGPGKVVFVGDGGGFGPTMLSYRITAGPLAGKVIFIGHAANPLVKVGDTFDEGAPLIAIQGGPGYGGNPGHVEIGFADPKNPGRPLAQAYGDVDPKTHHSKAGEDFKTMLGSLTGKSSPASVTDKAHANATQGTANKEAGQQAHLYDPWVTVTRDKKGNVTGFGEAYGSAPPASVLKQGSVPLTRSGFTASWSQSYNDLFTAFTGRNATPNEIANVLETGISTYGLKQRLAGFDPETGKYVGSGSFTASPVYQQRGVSIATRAKDTLGVKAPAGFVARAIVNGWDDEEIDAQLRQLPEYEHGPAFKGAYGAAEGVYKGIYGPTDTRGVDFLKHAVRNGWTNIQTAAALRADPSYKQSPEYQGNVLGFLEQMGLLIGSRPVLAATGKAPTGFNTAPPLTPKLPGAPGLA